MDSDVGKLFIGGISWETTEEKLKSYFRAYGEVVEAVIMKDRATGRARGFGFVVFADPSVADRVVQEKHTIDGRTVEAKKAVPREEQQNALRSNNGSLMPANQARTKKIFVGGLAASVTENDFRKYFEQFGTITDVVVMYDHSTQRPRGFGFITYTSEDAVDKVLQKAFHELKDKLVEVKRAIPKELSSGATRNNGAGLSPGLSRGPYAGAYGQGFNSPIAPYGARMDGRYSVSPSGGYSPYGAAGYAGSGNFNVNINPGYNASAYGGSGSFGGGGYGGAPNAGGLYGGNRGGYGGNIAASGAYGGGTPGRNVWSTRTVGYGGAGSSPYTGSGGSNLSGYGGFGTWSSSQSPGSATGYGSSSLGYGSSDGGYGSSSAGYAGRGGSYGSSLGSGYGSSLAGYGSALGSGSASGSASGTGAYNGGYGDILYNSSNYGETARKSPGFDGFNSSGIGSGVLGYNLNSNSSEAAGGYSGGYSSGRQSHRGVPAA